MTRSRDGALALCERRGLVQAVFGERVTAIIGPAFVGYSDSRHFRPVSSSEARLLLASDEAAIEMLHAACPVEDWEHGGSGYRPNAMIPRRA